MANSLAAGPGGVHVRRMVGIEDTERFGRVSFWGEIHMFAGKRGRSREKDLLLKGLALSISISG